MLNEEQHVGAIGAAAIAAQAAADVAKLATALAQRTQDTHQEVMLKLQRITDTQQQFQKDLHDVATDNAKINEQMSRMLLGDVEHAVPGVVARTASVESSVAVLRRDVDDIRLDYYGDSKMRGRRDMITMIYNWYVWVACTMSAGAGAAGLAGIQWCFTVKGAK